MKKYDNFFLPAANFEESKKFYSEVMKMPVKFDFSAQGMIAFKVGEEEPAIIIKDVNKFKDSKPCVWIEVEDVKETYKRLKSKGVQFLSEPFKIRTGWAVEFFDPSKNLLGFADYRND